MKRCIFCGTELKDAARFCDECGGVQPMESEADKESGTESKKSR